VNALLVAAQQMSERGFDHPLGSSF
jgi:hypothetical protein